jgi:dolichol-phosphate mannosyltransferase
MSWGVNTYARCLLGLRPRDTSGAFRCYRVSLLRQLDFSTIKSRGYSFQEEILWRLKRLKARMTETPILFADRERGQSKINKQEAISALWIILRLGMTNWFGI